MTISVRPSPRSVRTTVMSSRASPSGSSVIVNTSRSGSVTSRYSPFQRISWRFGPKYITSRHSPPGRTSISTSSSGHSASAPPYQSANRSGSVHSRQSSSRGASKDRVISIPGSSIVGISEARLEPIEAGLPEATVSLKPLDGLGRGRSLEPRGAELRRAAPGDQPRPLQHLEVLRDRLDADRERLGELVHGRLALRETAEDRPARRVGE